MPTLVARQVLEQLMERLYGWLPENPVLPGRSVLVLEGSTVTLPHSVELAKSSPAHRHQQAAASPWPLLRLVVLEAVQTGLAIRPHWGPETVSEQALGLQAIAGLPADAVLIGDRNVGVFGVAWTAHRHAHAILIRLTRPRAERLAGGRITAGSDTKVTWTPTRWDSCGGPYDSQAAVTGCLVCVAASGPDQQPPIDLFTTLDLPVEQIAKLYALRWNVETDLRSIKQTVHLQELSARSTATLEKELLLTFAAYHLARAVICLAAETAQVAPRRLSFTNVYTLLETFAPGLYAHYQADASDDVWNRLISIAARYQLLNRSKPRSYPRAVWPKPKRFPANHATT